MAAPNPTMPRQGNDLHFTTMTYDQNLLPLRNPLRTQQLAFYPDFQASSHQLAFYPDFHATSHQLAFHSDFQATSHQLAFYPDFQATSRHVLYPPSNVLQPYEGIYPSPVPYQVNGPWPADLEQGLVEPELTGSWDAANRNPVTVTRPSSASKSNDASVESPTEEKTEELKQSATKTKKKGGIRKAYERYPQMPRGKELLYQRGLLDHNPGTGRPGYIDQPLRIRDIAKAAKCSPNAIVKATNSALSAHFGEREAMRIRKNRQLQKRGNRAIRKPASFDTAQVLPPTH